MNIYFYIRIHIYSSPFEMRALYFGSFHSLDTKNVTIYYSSKSSLTVHSVLIVPIWLFNIETHVLRGELKLGESPSSMPQVGTGFTPCPAHSTCRGPCIGQFPLRLPLPTWNTTALAARRRDLSNSISATHPADCSGQPIACATSPPGSTCPSCKCTTCTQTTALIRSRDRRGPPLPAAFSSSSCRSCYYKPCCSLTLRYS
jgi:hypothetical protein